MGERHRLINARKHSRELRQWIFHRYRLVDMSGTPVDHEEAFFWPYLVQQARGLIQYKKAAEGKRMANRELYPCGLASVQAVVERSVRYPKPLWTMFKASANETVTSFAWSGHSFTVQEVNPPTSNGT